jgi:hypothetical protein
LGAYRFRYWGSGPKLNVLEQFKQGRAQEKNEKSAIGAQ